MIRSKRRVRKRWAWPTGLALLLLTVAPPALARSILFVGNSFTFADRSPVRRFHPDRVTDLNGDGFGGVPALFKTFATESGLDYQVSLETSPGKPLQWHLDNRAAKLAGVWDVVVLQGFSTLDPEKPGDPTRHIAAAKTLAGLFRKANPKAEVDLMNTWSRADLTYPADGPWHGKTIEAMAQDIAAANAQALKASPDLARTLPVGTGWNRAMREGVADPNPYDGIDFGKVSLWTWDQYHASTEGYYLEALIVFGRITGVDPVTLGEKETAANDLGMSPKVVTALQLIAHEELAATR